MLVILHRDKTTESYISQCLYVYFNAGFGHITLVKTKIGWRKDLLVRENNLGFTPRHIISPFDLE